MSWNRVPTFEKLPPEGERVLAYTVNNYYVVAVYSDTQWRRSWDFQTMNNGGYLEVTHWMKLPLPPKE